MPTRTEAGASGWSGWEKRRNGTEKGHLVGVDRFGVVATLNEVERSSDAGEKAGAVAVQSVDHVSVGCFHVVLTFRKGIESQRCEGSRCTSGRGTWRRLRGPAAPC